ncbi:hypothetical protein WA026_006354 [Henosepilachna vigintioctopunctata]|uniref:Uncharacterized protein n=1 Tax=Henosepilachna vigintioctopunctata TaxID=420089 RepID=A0AAW1TI78_9CUCU
MIGSYFCQKSNEHLYLVAVYLPNILHTTITDHGIKETVFNTAKKTETWVKKYINYKQLHGILKDREEIHRLMLISCGNYLCRGCPGVIEGSQLN